MMHHNVPPYNRTLIHYVSNKRVPAPYGVSPAMKVLSPQALCRKHDLIVRFLKSNLGLTTGQREAVLALLRYWSHYGMVYPKQSQLMETPGCSKATFWRTIALLKSDGLITVVNRYVVREQAQISNLYLLDNLIMAIAKFLSEHGQEFYQKWLAPVFEMPWRSFWRMVTPAALSPP
jgi:Fe2+ or Zn2+ uptake regulation protein